MFNVHLFCVIVLQRKKRISRLVIIIDVPDIRHLGVLYAIQTDFPNITVMLSDMRRNILLIRHAEVLIVLR